MSAITLEEALAFVAGSPGSNEVDECIKGLVEAQGVPGDLPTLTKLRKGAEGACKGATYGFFVVACLNAGTPKEIYEWACSVAPRVWSRAESGTPEGNRRAISLHADCYLALGEWVTQWNRSQIRRVA